MEVTNLERTGICNNRTLSFFNKATRSVISFTSAFSDLRTRISSPTAAMDVVSSSLVGIQQTLAMGKESTQVFGGTRG
jgi:hypothetical protein